MKEISADKDIKSYNNAFDASNPENLYSLNLAEMYDKIILQNLLSIAENSVNKNDGKFEAKACF